MPVLPTFMKLLLILTLTTNAAAELHRFSSWFPRYESALDTLVRTTCLGEHKSYETNSLNSTMNYDQLKIWGVEETVTPFINCLLENTPELYKFDMASSQVMLGLMPTILANVGPSVYETSMLFVYSKRELLAFLLTLGSPAVLFDDTIGFRQQLSDHVTSPDWISMDFPWERKAVTVVIEYLLTLAAIVNVGEICYELVMRSVFSIVQDAQYLPAIWIFLGIVTHVLAAFIMRKCHEKVRETETRKSYLRFDLIKWIRRQFSTSKTDPIHLKPRSRSMLETVISWFTGVLATINLIFGTLIYSSLLFISPQDALGIMLRFMASAIVCRVIVRYEVCMVRGAVRLLNN